MKTRNLFAVTLAVVLASSWLSVVLLPSTQTFMNSNTFWNGIYDFNSRFNVDTSFDNSRLADAGVPAAAGTAVNVLLEIPSLPFQPDELQRIRQFVDNGGTLVVLDDFGYGNQLLEAMGATVRFAAVPLLDPYLGYRNRSFPIITDLSPELKNAGVKQLILNHPTALSFNSGTAGYSILARSSDISFLDYNGNGAKDGTDARGPFAVAAGTKIGSGTVIAVSDPSIIVNSMVRRADNEKFVSVLVTRPDGVQNVALDQSHLPKAPLDVSKDAWSSIRQPLALPYVQVLLAAAIIMLSFMSLWNPRSLPPAGKLKPQAK